MSRPVTVSVIAIGMALSLPSGSAELLPKSGSKDCPGNWARLADSALSPQSEWLNYLKSQSASARGSWRIGHLIGLYDFSDEEILRVHRSLLLGNPKYKSLASTESAIQVAEEIIKTGKLLGNDRGPEDAADQLRIGMSTICKKLNLNPFEVDPDVARASALLNESQAFRDWASTRSPAPNWKSHPSAAARDLLQDWQKHLHEGEFKSESAAWLRHLTQAIKGSDWNVGDIRALFAMDDEKILETHRRLLSTHPQYRAAAANSDSFLLAEQILKTGMLNGSTRTREDAVDLIRNGLPYICKKLDLNPFTADPTLSEAGNMIERNAQFETWALARTPTPGWREDPVGEARKMLSEWELEVKSRYVPKPAAPGKSYVFAPVESQATQAEIGGKKYVASRDGKAWVAASGQSGVRFPVLPRWSGGNDVEFQIKLSEARNPGWQERMAAKYAPESSQAWQEPKAPSPPGSPPSTRFQGMKVYQQGQLIAHHDIHPPEQVRRYIAARAWGYHLMESKNLRGILEDGWIPNHHTASDSSGMDGLHLSTHLGLNYPIHGPRAVLRVKLDPAVDRAAGGVEWHGHIVRDQGIPSQRVPEEIEFSVDDGVTWFPMRSEMIRAAEENMLPTQRRIPMPGP